MSDAAGHTAIWLERIGLYLRMASLDVRVYSDGKMRPVQHYMIYRQDKLRKERGALSMLETRVVSLGLGSGRDKRFS